MTNRHLKSMVVVLMLTMMLILTSCAIDTTYPGTKNVVEAEAIVDALDQWVVIDARGKEAYDKGHLQGAICISPEALVVESPVPMTLPSQAQFEKVMSENGITPDSKVVIYDNNGGVSASRIWWTMRVFGHEKVMVINGGEAALVKAKAPLTAEATQVTPSQYVAKALNTQMVATFEDVQTLANEPKEGTVLLDVRSAAEYAEGFIPGAVLYPHTQNLYKDGTFMSSRDLGLFYKDADIQKDDLIIVYCKSSFRATQTVALLEEAGYTNLKVYDGAWLEWSSKVGVTAPTEEAPVGESDGS